MVVLRVQTTPSQAISTSMLKDIHKTVGVVIQKIEFCILQKDFWSCINIISLFII